MTGTPALLLLLALSPAAPAAPARKAARPAPPAAAAFRLPGQEAWDKLRAMRTEMTSLMAELEPIISRLDALPREHAAGRLDLDAWAQERGVLLAELRPLRRRLGALQVVFDSERERLEGLGVVASFGRMAEAGNAPETAPDTRSSAELLSVNMAAIEAFRRAELAEDDTAFAAAQKAREDRRNVRRNAVMTAFALPLLALALWLFFRRRCDVPALGTVLNGNYRLERRIPWEQAGYSRSTPRAGDAAYEAVDVALDRRVVLESLVVDADEDAGALLAGARAAAALKHPNLLEVYAFFAQDCRVCLVYEHFDGRPLSAHLAGGRKPAPAAAARLLTELASAVDYAHAHGVARLDLSPERILLAQDGRVKLAGCSLRHFKGSDRDALDRLRGLLAP